ncbi:MAG: pilus assembly protein TadG-related protein [Alphaproteobacteria bacterium]
MRDFFKSFSADTRGGVLIYTAILMPVFLGFMALGLDIAAWHIEKRQSQTMADAAAVAAAIEDFIIVGRGGTSPGCAAGEVFDAAADAAGFNNFDAGAGHTLTLNCPATLGDSAGITGSKEAIVSTPLPLFLASLVNVSVDGVSARSRAVAGASLGGNCILALNEDTAGAIDVAGGSIINIGCGVRANSDDDDAIRLNGTGSCVTASEVIATGGANGDCYNPTPEEGVNPAADPLESVPSPENAGCTFNSRINITGSSDRTLNPGTYCNDVVINTSGTVTFSPGVYIFDGAGLRVLNPDAHVIALNVMIVFTGGSNSNNFAIAAGTTWTQTAPSSGFYEGIAFWTRDENSYDINFTGGANMNITGVIYAPNQDIKFAGGTSGDGSNAFIIADEITFTGNTTVVSSFDPDAPPFFSNFLVVGKLVE